MHIIQTFSPGVRIYLYILMALMGLFSLLVFGWQIIILKGKAMKNLDGTSDDYHELKTHYGIALADVLMACPVSLVAIILVLVFPRWGFYMLGMVAFWFVWTNLLTTATSLRFEKPKLTLNWWFAFPTGILVGWLISCGRLSTSTQFTSCRNSKGE
jgi:hypothetical protein